MKMWWDILKGSLTTAEYLKELDKFRMFRRIGLQSEYERTSDNLTVTRKKGNMDTDYEKLFYDNEIEEGVESLFKFRGGSFVKRLDDYTVYFSLEEQENLHHFIFKVKVTNISPEKRFKLRDADKEFEWEIIFFNEGETNEETVGDGWLKPELFPLELFVDSSAYAGRHRAKGEIVGKDRKDYFISRLSEMTEADMLTDNWKENVRNLYYEMLHGGYRPSPAPFNQYYQNAYRKIIEIIKQNSPILIAQETIARHAEGYYSRLPDGPPPVGYGRQR